MRFDGLLVEWSDAYGCGLVQADQGGDPLVVEAAAFVDDGGRPVKGQAVSFEVRLGATGHKEAVEVRRARADAPWGPGAARPERSTRAVADAPAPAGGGLIRRGLVLAVLAGAGFLGVQAWQPGLGLGSDEAAEQAEAADDAEAAIEAVGRGRTAPAARPEPTGTAPEPTVPAARCDGRTQCSQMRSCAEARWFLKHCPGTEMDGDRDGIPCETQWCSPS